MKQKKLLLAALAFALILTASIGTAVAYFTANASASGDTPIHLANQTHIEETVHDQAKHLVIVNDDPTAEVFVRAKAFCNTPYTLTYSGGGWSDGNNDSEGWCYYGTALSGSNFSPKNASSELVVSIGNIPGKAEEGDTFHVEVVFESVPAVYNDSGVADMGASWKTGTSEVTIVTKGGNG